MVNGVKFIIEELDKLYQKDESSLVYEAYEKLERPHAMSKSGYVIKFEHQIAKSHKMEVLDGLLAYMLLNKAYLPEEKKQLVRATVKEMKYEIMKEQLKKVFNSLSSEKRCREEVAKLEQNDSFYARKILLGESSMKKFLR